MYQHRSKINIIMFVTLIVLSIVFSILYILYMNSFYKLKNEVFLANGTMIIKNVEEMREWTKSPTKDLTSNSFSRNLESKLFDCCLPNHEECKLMPLPENVPKRFDWRSTGYVGPVLKQKFNVCWAFSITGVFETLAANISKTFTRLSIQEVIDLYDRHINFGNTKDVVGIICHYHKLSKYAITTEEDYPLSYKNESIQKNIDRGSWLQSYKVYQNVNSTLMKQLLVNRGPLIARVNSYPWINYIDGIIQFHCKSPDSGIVHSVQIVGYVEDTPIPYYIIKNSWGTNFGEKGYVKIAMDNFVCGVGIQIIALNVYNSPSKSVV